MTVNPSLTLRSCCHSLAALVIAMSFFVIAPSRVYADDESESSKTADVSEDGDDHGDHDDADEADHSAAEGGEDHADGDHAGGHAGVDEENMPPLLNIDIGGAIVNLAIFLGVFFILSKFAWPPILEGLKAREQKIHGDLVAAEKANEEAKAMLADYQTKLDEAANQVQGMLADARKDADAAATRIVDEAKAEGDRQRERAMADIDAAKRAAISDLANQTGAMAIGVAKQVVGRELRPEDHAELIRSSLDRLPSEN